MKKILIETFFSALEKLIFEFAATIPLGIAAGIISFLILCRQKNKIVYSKRGYIALFVSYIMVVLENTILFRPMGQISSIVLIPFPTRGGARYMLLYALANGLLFVPLGVLLPCVWDKAKKFKWCILAGMLLSIFIELSQFILKCGVVQTEDLIMNILGTAIGYLIFFIFLKNTCNSRTVKNDKQHNGEKGRNNS